ncbi:phage tail protein [Pseudomonas sp. RSB 5.4]|uniref:phage tail protein n=1 Tax=Pseudomonas sp. RSB 5.4 TaxID=3127459 RepID=UPI0030D26574
MKAATAAAAQLAQMKALLATKNTAANAQILRIQDRIDTLGYGIDAGEATEADEDEQSALFINLKAWKAYKFSLGKVTSQVTWPTAPTWPAEPPIPDIKASPMARATDES